MRFVRDFQLVNNVNSRWHDRSGGVVLSLFGVYRRLTVLGITDAECAYVWVGLSNIRLSAFLRKMGILSVDSMSWMMGKRR